MRNKMRFFPVILCFTYVNANLPIIEIHTENAAIIEDKINYVNMKFSLIDLDNPDNNVFKTNFKDGIRGRGNYSWFLPQKKTYRIKFDKKTSLFGLKAAKSWILLAEYLDPTFLITPTAFHLGDIFGISFNHSFYHVQLYLNGQYNGLYILTEQNQTGAGRVDIDENKGWFVEMDIYYDKDPKFKTTNYDLPIMIKSPEAEPLNINNPVYNFVRKDINELCDLMASVKFPENGYRELIDMSTFVDYLLINEVVLNHELGYPKSVYAYKDKGGKISMGPLWDFDWAFSHTDEHELSHEYFKGFGSYLWKHNFFERFFDDPIFLVKYKERWNEKRYETAAVPNFIENIGAKIKSYVAEDSERWKTSYNYTMREANYDLQVSDMKNWWNNRVNWLNTELNKIEVLPKNKIFASHVYNYSNIPPQTFTLVAYDDIENLSVTLKNTELQNFKISAINKEATGNGGYLATISVKPLNSLPATTYTDTLILSGNNQGKPFSLKVSLITRDGQVTNSNILIRVINNEIVIKNLPYNAKVKIYNIQGKLVYLGNSLYSQILNSPAQAKGIYFVKVGAKTFRISVM